MSMTHNPKGHLDLIECSQAKVRRLATTSYTYNDNHRTLVNQPTATNAAQSENNVLFLLSLLQLSNCKYRHVASVPVRSAQAVGTDVDDELGDDTRISADVGAVDEMLSWRWHCTPGYTGSPLEGDVVVSPIFRG